MRNVALGGIEEFERTLERLDQQPKAVTTQVKPTTKEDTLATPELHQTIGNDATAYLKKIKTKKQDENASRKEKEQRRRKVLMEQQQVFKDLEEARRREVLLEKLMKKSAEERNLAKELNQIKQLKQVMKENREVREKQYAERRRKDFEEKQQREKELMEKEREERKQKKKQLIEKHKLLLDERSQKKKEKHTSICKEVTDHLVDLAMREIGYMETTEGDPPSSAEVSQWKKMFVKGAPLNEEEQSIISEVDILEKQTVKPPSTFNQDVIDLAEFKEYFNYKGAWEEELITLLPQQTNDDSAPIEIISPFVKSAIQEIHHKIYPLPAPKTSPKIKSKYPYNVVVCGKPMSGKTTVCQKLSALLSIYLINPEKLLKALIEPLPNQPQIAPQEYQEIAMKAKACMKEGREVEASLIVDLIVIEIEKVEKLENSQYQGWIIEGFPTNVEAAQLLEKKISGFTSSIEEFIRNEKIEEFQNSEDGIGRNFNSLLVKEFKETKNEHEIMKSIVPFKSFTTVLFIDVEDDQVFERLVNQKVDPVTGNVYHMTYSPPDNVEILSRLVPIDEHSNLDRAQINTQLLTYNKTKRQLLSFYKTFENVFEVSEENLENLVNTCVEILEETKRQLEDSSQPHSENWDKAEISRVEITEIQKKELDIDFCKLFLKEWQALEQHYVDGVKIVFRNLREFRKTFFKQFSDLKEQFMQFLLRPDDKQSFISAFQTDFNRFSYEMRSNQQLKQELHRRTDELKETLWNLCDEKKMEAEKELSEHMKEPWLQTHKRVVVRQHMQLIQLELNRYIEQAKFIFDYLVEQYLSADLNQAPIDPKKPVAAGLLSVNVEDLFVDVISSVNNMKSPTAKKTSKPPSNASSTRPKSAVSDSSIDANIEECFERAKSAVESIDLLGMLQSYIDKNSKKKKEASKTKELYPDVPQELKEAQQQEKELFMQRIAVIKSRCTNAVREQIDNKSQHIFDTMKDWIGQRYRTDMANIALLTRTIQDYIEKETPIIHQLRIEGNKCILDESVQTTSPLPQVPSSHSRKIHLDHYMTTSFSKAFTPHQVYSLFERLQAPSPSGFSEIEEMTTTLLILIDSTFGSMELPPQWLEYDNDKVKAIASRFDPFKKGYINWRVFLLSALFSFFHNIPTIEDIRKLLTIVHPLVSENELDLKPEQFTEIIVRWIAQTNLSTNEDEVAKVLFNIFKPDPMSTTVNIKTVLLYLCMDNQSALGTLTKGFEVLSYFNGTEGLNDTAVFELFNFNLDVEEEIEDSFSLSQMRAVFSEIKSCNRNISLEQFCCSSIGRMIVNHAQHLKLSSVFY